MKEKVARNNDQEKEELLEGEAVFSLRAIKTRGQLAEVERGNMVDVSQEKEVDAVKPLRKKVTWQDDYYASRDRSSEDEEEGVAEGSDVSDVEWESDQNSDDDNHEEEGMKCLRGTMGAIFSVSFFFTPLSQFHPHI